MKNLFLHSALAAIFAIAPFATQAAPFSDPQASAPIELGASRIVSNFSVGNFLEGLVVEGNQAVISDYVAQSVFRVDLRTGARTLVARLPTNVGGIAARPGGYVVTKLGAEPGIYSLDRSGAFREVVKLPKNTFPNGIAAIGNGRYLVADSAGSGIWLVDVRTGSARVWLSDALLTPSGPHTPFLPGANGLQVRNGYVYVSSMQRKLLLRARINADGSAGALETVASNVFLDDFAVARDGTVFATTHVFDSVIRIAPNGRVTTIANHDSGLRGPTSLAFGHRRGNNQPLYVTNNGQFYIQPAEGPDTGRLVEVVVPASTVRN